MTLPIVVLVSGYGSNLRAVHQAIAQGNCDAQILAVVSDRKRAAALEFAASQGLPTACVPLRAYPDRAAWDAALTDVVARFEPAVVVAAGFMRILGSTFVSRFEHRTINVHPALLPLFPGLEAPAQAITARVPISGCTVHLVDQGVDTGPILAQAVVRVAPSDTADALHTRIQVAEHRLLPRVIAAVAAGHLQLGPVPLWRGPLPDCAEVFSSF